MSTASRPNAWANRTNAGLVFAFVGMCLLWGGGSRIDIPYLIFLYPLVILIGAALLILPGEFDWSSVRIPLVLLSGLTLIIAVQLVPFPPEIWLAFPGRAQFEPFLTAAGAADVWRPLTLDPDFTISTLFGMSIPAVALIGFAKLPMERNQSLLPLLLVGSVISLVLGIGQLVGGAGSAFYRYSVTNPDAAVGLFANRNHQAVFLAMIWPMLAIWVVRRGLSPQQRKLRQWIGGAGAIALIPMLFVTGSRAGLLLGVIGIAFAVRIVRAGLARSSHRTVAPSRLRRMLPFAIAFAAFGIALLAVLLSRDVAVQRLYATNLAEENRLTSLPILLRIVADFFPFGSGFGSFDVVYRVYEPDALLRATYFNHAHNDLVELLITGGLPAAIVLIAFVVWAVPRTIGLFRRPLRSSADDFAFLGVAMIVLLMLASLVDYPLRTPAHAMLFAFACGWLARSSAASDRPAET